MQTHLLIIPAPNIPTLPRFHLPLPLISLFLNFFSRGCRFQPLFPQRINLSPLLRPFIIFLFGVVREEERVLGVGRKV